MPLPTTTPFSRNQRKIRRLAHSCRPCTVIDIYCWEFHRHRSHHQRDHRVTVTEHRWPRPFSLPESLSTTSPPFSDSCLLGPILADRSLDRHRRHDHRDRCHRLYPSVPLRRRFTTVHRRHLQKSSTFGQNSSRPRQPLPPLTTPTPSTLSGLPIPTTGRP